MLELKNISKGYRKGRRQVAVLDRFDYSFEAGRFYAVHGPSGIGKTTLLLMLGGMLRPDQGEVLFGERDIYRLAGRGRRLYRRSTVGFVFQNFHLLPYLSVLDNIRLPLTIQRAHHDVERRVREAAERLGLSDRLNHRPAELSVGQQQRVALARVLAGDPSIILADEPTGNLDETNQTIISNCLHEEAAKGKLVVAVTHEQALLKAAHQRIELGVE